MMRWHAAATMTVLVITAGCGGSDSSSDTAAPDTTPVATTVPAATTTTIPVPIDEAIAGTISFDGEIGAGVILVLANIVGDNGPPAYAIVIEQAGAYVLTGVADGEYVVQAFLDTADDRGPPEADEPQGFYDPNGDGTPDSVIVAGGAGLIGIDITLV